MQRQATLCIIGASAWLLLILLPVTQNVFGQDWQLVWSDEFDSGLQPDPEKWSYQVGAGGWGNSEWQYYTDARPENARLEDGRLIIEARNESYAGAPYTSARLRTLGKGDWTYGRFEIRAKLPEGLGTWAAIWMMPSEAAYGDGGWPDNGEIDIMEAVGFEPEQSHSAIHVNALNHIRGNNPSSTVTNPTSRSDFHIYALEWTPSQITTFVDETPHLVYERVEGDWTRWPFDRSFHLILNLAVGGTWGGLQGVDPSHFPARFEIDYVRVFEDASGPPQITIEGRNPRQEGSGFVRYEPGDSVNLFAQASDSDGDIVRLAIRQEDGLLATDSQSSLEHAIHAASPGCYALVAMAQDSDGWEAISDTLHVQVGDTCVQAPYLMTPPTVPGTFEAEYFDIGGSGVSYLDLSEVNTGGALRRNDSVDIGQSNDIGGGYQIQDVTFREWIEYTVDVSQTGFYVLEARLAATKDGSISLSVDGEEWPDALSYQSTNSTSFFRDARLDGIWLEKGHRTLRMTFSTFGVYLNRFELSLSGSTEVDHLPERTPIVFDAFPNPFGEAIAITLGRSLPQGGVLQLYDATGRLVLDRALHGALSEGDQLLLEMPGSLPAGAYFMILKSGADRFFRPLIRY